MTGPQPPEPPYSPQFRVPPMTPVQPGGLDDPDRRQRMRMGVLGTAIGFGIPLLIIGVAIAIAIGSAGGATGSDRWVGGQIVLLAGTVLASPIQIITGIVLAAVQRTRPFGVGFLIGSAVGLLVMAGACFAPLAA